MTDFMESLHRHMGDENRQRDEGPPAGTIDRRGPRAPDDPGCLEVVEKKAGSVAGILTAIGIIVGGGLTVGVFANPFQTKAAAQEAQAAVNLKVEEHDRRITAVENRLGSIDRNQLRSLSLQLRATMRSLDDDLKALPVGSPGRRNLEAQRDQASEDLEDVKRQLDGTGR